MDNEKTKEIELVSEGDTKTFDKAGDDDSALYAFAGGEECLFELTRTPCAKGAELLRRHNWYTHKNTRFVVYAMFFAILLVFSVYYAVVGSYMIAAFAGAVGAFMLYIVLCGHRYFVTGMSFDENGNNDAVLSCKLCTENIYLLDKGALSVVSYSQITAVKTKEVFLIIQLKNQKDYASGILLDKTSLSADQGQELFDLLVTKSNIQQNK